jgi:cell division protein FtsZ
MNLARQSLDLLKHSADAVAVLPNQPLADAADETLGTEGAFALSDETLAAGLGALARLLTVRGLVNIDFGTLRSMLRHCGGFCWFSAAVQKEDEPLDLFVSRLVKAPQFNQGEALRNSHGALLGITAGPGLSFKTLQELVQQVGDWLPTDILLRWGITLEEAPGTPLSALLLTAKSEAEPEPEEPTAALESTNTARADTGPKKQTELPFITAQEGFFHKAEPTLYQGQDLDRPSYLRRGIRLP